MRAKAFDFVSLAGLYFRKASLLELFFYFFDLCSVIRELLQMYLAQSMNTVCDLECPEVIHCKRKQMPLTKAA